MGQRIRAQAKQFSNMRLSERAELVISFGNKVLDKYAKKAEEHSKVEHTVLPLGVQGMGIFVPPRGSNSLSPVLRRILSGNEPSIEPMLAVKFFEDKAEMTFHPAYAPLVELIRQEYNAAPKEETSLEDETTPKKKSPEDKRSWKERFGLDLETRMTEVKR